MAKNIELPGCLYKRGDRWYWKVQLPGEPRFKIRPMIPTGGRYATKEYHTAEKIAQDMLLRAAGNVAKTKNCYNGRMATLVALYLKHAKSYYRKADGITTNQYMNVERSVGYLVKHCSTMLAEDFGPRKLKDIREIMIEKNLSRSTVNKYVGIIKQMFKWAASDELIPGGVYHGLMAVSGLKRGRSDARETEPVKPAPAEEVLRVLPYASKVVAAMIELHLHTGMRSSELCIMRPLRILISLAASGSTHRRSIRHSTLAIVARFHLGHAVRRYCGRSCFAGTTIIVLSLRSVENRFVRPRQGKI